MSVDPKEPSSSDPAPAKTPADPSAENLDALRLKRRFKKGGAESEEGEKSDQTIQMLSSLLQDLIAKKESTAAPEIESRPTKYHRLSKTGSGSPAGPSEGAAPGTPAATGGSAGTASTPGVEPSAAAIPPPVTFRAAPVFEPMVEARRRRRLHVLYILGALVLATGAYWVGSRYGVAVRRDESPNKPSPAVAATWTDAMLGQLNQALAADQAGDLKGAQQLVLAIKKPDAPSPPGLELYQATLSTRLEHSYDVEADLLRAISNASPEKAAALNERLAFNFSRARDFEKATEFYKASSRLDPFPASVYYHWGEALRHLGHFPEAVTSFRQALDRIPTGQPEAESLRECANLKLRLALLEQGREGDFQAEMAEQTKASSPSGYWLLTAAAVALQHKNTADAADLLGKARDALGAMQFDDLLNDYFFRAYAGRKELADFFPPDPGARRAKLKPTMTYTVEP